MTPAYRIAVLGIVYFLIPVLGVVFLISVNQELVPRSEADSFFNELANATPARSPAALAQIYHMAIAGGLTVLVSIASIVQSLRWQAQLRPALRGLGLPWLMPLLWLGCAFPLWQAINQPGFIDDDAISRLFEVAGLKTLNGPRLFGYDARILGAFIFTAYCFAAVTTALAAVSIHAADATESPSEAKRLMGIVRGSLLLTSLVLLAAVVTAKLRLDVGIHMLPSATEAYATIAGAIMNYWALVLSAGLALIYLGPALHLYAYYPPDSADVPNGTAGVPWLSQETLGQAVRLIAILSPPILTTLTNLFFPAA